MSQKIKLLLLIILLGVGGFFCSNNLNAQNGLININTASLKELDTLPGIGPSKAQAIIDYRDANGSFATIEEIMNVSGIGQVTFDNIKDSITVGDAPLEEPPPEPPPEEPPPGEPPAPPPGGSTPPPTQESYSNKIIINELMINPEDSDADNEYVELYNKSDITVNLSSWRIEDTQGSTKKFTIPDGTMIGGWSYVVFYSSDSRLVFNNSGDGAKLFWPDGILIDETPMNSGPADDDESYSRDADEWYWTVTPTPGEKNEILSEEDKTYLVTRVIDGDTVEIETGEKVR